MVTNMMKMMTMTMTKKGGKLQPKGNYDHHLPNGDDDLREYDDLDDDADDDDNA